MASSDHHLDTVCEGGLVICGGGRVICGGGTL